MRLNFDRAPFTDEQFRRALALAIRPGEVLRRVALGRGLPGSVGYPPPAARGRRPTSPSRATIRRRRRACSTRAASAIATATAGVRTPAAPRCGSDSRWRATALQLRAARWWHGSSPRSASGARVDIVDPARLRALYTARQFDLLIGEVTAHTLVDPDQLVVSFMTGYLWRHGVPHPRLDAALERWQAATTPQARIEAGFALQRLHQEAPVVLMLYYPAGNQAYRPGAYDGWRPVPGMGVFTSGRWWRSPA